MARTIIGAMLLALSQSAMASAAAAAGSPTPVLKVIGLLEKLKTQSEDEGQQEAIAYDKFACFCKAQAEAKIEYISKATDKVTLNTARIKKYGAEIVDINGDVTETNTQIAALEKQMADRAKTRENEHHEYTIQRSDLAEAVRGATEAIEMMKSSDHTSFLQEGTGAGAKLAQLLSIVGKATSDNAMKRINTQQTARLMALMDVTENLGLTSPGAEGGATGFQFHSGEIIENLMKVQKDFKNQKNDVETTEADTKHEYDMGKNAMSNQLKAMQTTVAKNEAIIAMKEQKKNNAEADRQKMTEQKDADQKFLDNLVIECEKTAKAWDAQSQTRANELMAVTEALEIIKGKVSDVYGANKKLNLLSTEEGGHGHWEWVQDQVSFLQPRRPTRHSHSSAEQKLFRYLNKQAIVLKSPQLSTLAMKMKEDHFKKVRTMIKDLVAKLEADAESEQTQKGWCDDEMEKATSKRDENIGAIEGDTASVTDAKASIDQLNTEIKDLETEIANLYKALNEATALRTTEKEENTKTIDDATAGLSAVKAAIKVLKDFYEDTSFVQVGSAREPIEGAPETGLAGEGFEGNQQQSKGIIGLMEVISSDFEGTIELTTDTETEADEQYVNYKGESDTTIQEKKSLMRSKKEDVRETKSDLLDYKDNLKEHNGLKTEALSELAKLTPTCVGTGVSYEERVARREHEIQSLKNSYKILDDMGASR